MPMNAIYHGPTDLPDVIPVFPLPGALLLPRGQMPLNIFEPRYLAMIDDALASRHRLIGMIQPDSAHPGPRTSRTCSRSAASAASPRSPKAGDGRYLLAAHRRGALPHRGGADGARRATGSAASTYAPFADDFVARKGEDDVDRKAVLRALADFLQGQQPEGRLGRHRERAQRGAGQRAGDDVALWRRRRSRRCWKRPDLKTRAEILVAVTEIELAKNEQRRRNAAAVVSRMTGQQRRALSPGMTERRGTTMPDDPPAVGSADSVDPKLLEILVCPLTKATLEYDRAQAGADLAQRQARLPDPRRHPDHAAGRGAEAGLTTDCRLDDASASRSRQAVSGTKRNDNAENLGTQHVVECAEGDVGDRRTEPRNMSASMSAARSARTRSRPIWR